jgi:hypothetical protein
MPSGLSAKAVANSKMENSGKSGLISAVKPHGSGPPVMQDAHQSSRKINLPHDAMRNSMA